MVLKIEKKYLTFPTLFFDIFIFFILSILICQNNVLFLVVIVINIFCLSIITFYKKLNFDKFHNDVVTGKNEFNLSVNSFFNFVNNEKNYFKSKQIISQNQNLLENNFKITNKKIFNESLLESLNSFLNNFIFLLLIFISTLLIYRNEKLNLGNILYSFSLLNLINSSTTSLFDFLSKKNIYKRSENYLNDLQNLYKLKTNNLINSIESVNSIEINDLCFSYSNNKNIFNNLNLKIKNDTFVFGNSGSGKTTLLRILMNDYYFTKGKIFINNIDKINISERYIREKVIYVPNSFSNPNLDFSNFFSKSEEIKEKIIWILKKFNFNIVGDYWKNLSKGQKQIILFISLMLEKNKIILLDESLSNIDKTCLSYLMKEIKPIILKNNFLIFVSHNLNLKKYFLNSMEIKNE